MKLNKDVCKNKLSEKNGKSILGYCILKPRFFQLSLKKKFLDKVDNLKSWYKENKKSKIFRIKNTFRQVLQGGFRVKNLKLSPWLVAISNLIKKCLDSSNQSTLEHVKHNNSLY